MKTLFAVIMVMMMSLSSSLVMAKNSAGHMPIYRCVINNDEGKSTELQVPLHICQLKGGKTIF